MLDSTVGTVVGLASPVVGTGDGVMEGLLGDGAPVGDLLVDLSFGLSSTLSQELALV